MVIWAPIQSLRNRARHRLRLRLILALIVAFIPCRGYATPQQSSASTGNHRSSCKIPSPFQEAKSLLARGLVDQAKEKIQEQLKLNPSSVEGYNLLGIAYSDQTDYANALDAFQHALKLDLNSTKTRNNLANLYVVQQKPDLAEKEFRRVLRLDPANRDGNYNLGLLRVAKGVTDDARPRFPRVRPPNRGTRYNPARAYLRVGRAAEGWKVAKELSA